MKRIPHSKTDYNLSIRHRLRNGEWSEWKDKGSGKFETIEIVQRQIRILATAYPKREKEVKFEWNGMLCDFNGKATGKTIFMHK